VDYPVWEQILGGSMLVATVFMVFPAMKTEVDRRNGVLRYLGWWLFGGVALSYAGYRWWEAVLPGTVLNLFRGVSPASGRRRRLIPASCGGRKSLGPGFNEC